MRTPSLRRHKTKSLGVVTLNGHDIYLGPWPPNKRKHLSTSRGRLRPGHHRRRLALPPGAAQDGPPRQDARDRHWAALPGSDRTVSKAGNASLSVLAARCVGQLEGPATRRPQEQGATGQSVYAIVRRLGDAAGIRARPHGLRHSAVTRLLDLGVDLRRVARFSRHCKLETLVKYDDNRQDLAGEMAATLAADV